MIEYEGKQITVMSCSDCNTKCSHCYISYEGNLSGEELYNICNILKKKYKVIINGTEVLMHEDYLEALTISDQNRVLTNGLIIYYNDDLIKKIADTGIKRVAMSYHFESDVSTVPHKIIEEDILKLKKYNLTPELMCTITNKSYKNLDAMCENTLSLGVHTLRLFNCLKTGRCEDLNDYCLNEEELNQFFAYLEEIRDKYDKEVLKIKRNGTFGSNPNDDKNKFNCPAGINEVVITPSLDVYPCIYMTKKGYEIGKYIDGKVMLYGEIENYGMECIANEVFNKNKQLELFKK